MRLLEKKDKNVALWRRRLQGDQLRLDSRTERLLCFGGGGRLSTPQQETEIVNIVSKVCLSTLNRVVQ